MVWLSVNPNCEDCRSIDAALALAAAPENAFNMFCLSVVRSEIDPVFLAQCYNNAESLELDLFFEQRISNEPDMDALYREHENFIQDVVGAVLADLSQRRNLLYGHAHSFLRDYDPATKTYDRDLLG